MVKNQLINCQRNCRVQGGGLMNTSSASPGPTNATNLKTDQQEPHFSHIRKTRRLLHAFKTFVKEAVLKVCRKKSKSNKVLAPCDEKIGSAGDDKQDQSQGSSREDTSAFTKYPIPFTRPINQRPPVAENSSSDTHSMASLAQVEGDSKVPTRSDQADPSPHPSASTTITVEQTSSAGNAQPVELDIQTQTVQYIPADGASNSSRGGTRGELPSSWKTQFKMVIHLPNKDSSKTRIAKLDTGSAVNVVSKPVAEALGMNMEPYYGADVVPLGGTMRPLGQLTLDWHVMGKGKTYTTTFLVLESEEFDVLLSDETIGRIGFYTVNNEIWYLNKGH